MTGIPCPRCVKGTVSGSNGSFWRCGYCHGTGRVRSQPTVWVNVERTVLVRQYSGGRLEVATRPHTDAVWGPPVPVTLETQ